MNFVAYGFVKRTLRPTELIAIVCVCVSKMHRKVRKTRKNDETSAIISIGRQREREREINVKCLFILQYTVIDIQYAKIYVIRPSLYN